MSGVRAPASGGTLVLAEPYGGWSATLNGTALKPLAAPVRGWAQGFVLPPGGGRLVVTRNNVTRELSLVAELIALLAVCALALPGTRADPAEEAEALAAVRAMQHAGQASAGQRSDGSKRSGKAGRRALEAARGGRVGRAAVAGLGVVRRRAAPTEADAEDSAPTGSGVGVLADGVEPDPAGHWDSDPRAPAPTGPRPAEVAPWDSGDWGQAPDWDDTAAYAGAADRRDSARWHNASDWDADRREGTRRDERSRRDERAPRDESAERHSHRASKHGRPGRRRGSGDRSGKDGES
jgi:hypothetical protein